MMPFEHVRVSPYVGANYGQHTPWGLPILIVGESHYSKDGVALNAEYTQETMEEVLDGLNLPFFTKTVGLFYRAWPNLELRRQFWSTAVFYNFVQQSVGARARIRPSREMWEEAVPAFEEVLIRYQPGFVLVLGDELWQNLPISPRKGPVVALPDGQTRECCLYPNDAGFAVTFGIAHPSSRGWSYKKWTPWVRAALTSAVEFQSSGYQPSIRRAGDEVRCSPDDGS